MGVELGDEVECIITGFRGVALSRYTHYTNETRIFVQPKVDVSYILPDGQVFEEKYLRVVTKNSKLEAV